MSASLRRAHAVIAVHGLDTLYCAIAVPGAHVEIFITYCVAPLMIVSPAGGMVNTVVSTLGKHGVGVLTASANIAMPLSAGVVPASILAITRFTAHADSL